MKKAIILMIALSSVFFITCGGGTKKGVTQLSYSIFFPASHGQCKDGIAWAKEIEKRSGGKIKINVFPGGALTKAKECYDGVVKGISDIGMSCFAYTRGRFPVMEAIDLPMGYKNGLVASKTANDYFNALKPKELDQVKVLYIHAHGPGLLHSQKPVKSLADLKGMKIRSTGLSSKIVKALGGTAVAMPQGATYEALQKGVVEGTFGPIETLKGWKQGEVIKYTTDVPDIGYTTAMFVVMNKAKWNALSDDVKKIFIEVSKKYITVHAKTWDKLDIEGRKFTKKRGNKILKLSAAENKKWIKAVQPIVSGYIKDAKAKGIDGAKNIAELKKAIKKNSK